MPKFHKAPNFDETLGQSLMDFANAQPVVAAFVVLMLLAWAAKVFAS